MTHEEFLAHFGLLLSGSKADRGAASGGRQGHGAASTNEPPLTGKSQVEPPSQRSETLVGSAPRSPFEPGDGKHYTPYWLTGESAEHEAEHRRLVSARRSLEPPVPNYSLSRSWHANVPKT